MCDFTLGSSWMVTYNTTQNNLIKKKKSPEDMRVNNMKSSAQTSVLHDIAGVSGRHCLCSPFVTRYESLVEDFQF